MKEKLLNSIACPICFAKLNYSDQEQTLTCLTDGLIFPIVDGIPVLLEDEAKPVNITETGETL